ALNTMWDETGLSPADIGHVELNEAFASQSLAVIRDSGLSMEQTNPYGGAIALGHPIGATGAVLTLRALYAMRRNNHEYVIVTACIGGGQALALLFKNAASDCVLNQTKPKHVLGLRLILMRSDIRA